MTDLFRHYREVWLCDFEFRASDGQRPEPVCMVAQEFRTGQTLRVWSDRLGTMSQPPFPVRGDSLFVAYFASAELGCFLALGWPMPARVLDLFTEFRCATNGRPTVAGNGLVGAMAQHGLDAIDAAKRYGNRFGALPYTVIIDRQGNIALTHRGELSRDLAESSIAGLL